MDIVFVAIPVVLYALGFPMYVVLITTAAALMLFKYQVPLDVTLNVMYGSVDKFSLLAVPFFIFAGEVIGRGGLARRLIEWFLALLGHIRGSLALVTVASSEFFGAISGSSPATVAAIGKIMYPSLLRRGYTERFASALVTASGAIAIIIPPSISMVLYSAATNASLARLFLAGFLPGLLIGAGYFVYILYYARRHGIVPGAAFSLPKVGGATLRAVWALGVPVIILGGIYSGIFTPTEAAGVSAVYGILIGVLVHQELDLRQLLAIANDSARLTAQIFLIVAGAGLLSYMLTIGQIPQGIVATIRGAELSGAQVLLVINLFLLLVGMLIDPASATLVLAPLFLPIVKAVGVDDVHFGIIMTVNLAIGMFTPPFGLNLFVTQSLFKVPVARIIPGLVPFILWNLVALAIVTYWPGLSLVLPSLLMG